MSSSRWFLLYLHSDCEDAALDILPFPVIGYRILLIGVSVVGHRHIRSLLCTAKANRKGTHEIVASCNRMELW